MQPGMGRTVSRASADGGLRVTELHRPAIAAATLVANPGCYPTAALLALAPLAPLGLLDVVIDAKRARAAPARRRVSARTSAASTATWSPTGSAGTGTTPRSSPVSPCRRTRPVLIRATRGTLRRPRRPRSRSCLTSCRWRAASSRRSTCAPGGLPSRPGRLRAALRRGLRGRTFVRSPARRPSSRTWSARTAAASSPRSTAGPALILVVAIDNLIKGAAGQAVQNLNVMAGLPETRACHDGALSPSRRSSPRRGRCGPTPAAAGGFVTLPDRVRPAA